MPPPNESHKKKAIWINGNRYETTNIIDQGGQGIVYRAVDSGGGRFAIKVVTATEHSPSRNFERTLEEAQWCEKWHSERIEYKSTPIPLTTFTPPSGGIPLGIPQSLIYLSKIM